MIRRRTTYRLALLLCLPAAMLMLCGMAAAQPRLRAPEMYIGVHGGVEASTLLFSPKVDNMSPFTHGVTLGGDGGVVFRYAGHKVCGLQVELNYMHRGWREELDGAVYQRHLHYLEVPFLMHLYFGQKSMVRGFLNLGPQIGVCVADQHGGTPLTSTGKQYNPIDSRFDWGLAAGLGMYVRTNKAGVYQLEVRANYSLGSPFSTRRTDYFQQAAPLDVSLNLGWLWPLNRGKSKANNKNIQNI